MCVTKTIAQNHTLVPSQTNHILYLCYHERNNCLITRKLVQAGSAQKVGQRLSYSSLLSHYNSKLCAHPHHHKSISLQTRCQRTIQGQEISGTRVPGRTEPFPRKPIHNLTNLVLKILSWLSLVKKMIFELSSHFCIFWPLNKAPAVSTSALMSLLDVQIQREKEAPWTEPEGFLFS